MDITKKSELEAKALNGDAQAQYRLAKMIDVDIHDKEDVKSLIEAVKWYRKAAEQGHVKAQCQLGTHLTYNYINYYRPDIPLTDHNMREGVMWLKKAAEQNSVQACCQLAECYWHGCGCDKDLEEAARWAYYAERLLEESGGSYNELWGRCDDLISDLRSDCGEDLMEELKDEMPSMEYEYVSPSSFGEGLQASVSHAAPSGHSAPSHSTTSSTGCFTTLLAGLLVVTAILLFVI